MGKVVTFKEDSKRDHYRGSLPGLGTVWFRGENREVSDDVAAYLLETFPHMFEAGAEEKKQEPPKKAKPRAMKASAPKAPRTVKKRAPRAKKKADT